MDCIISQMSSGKVVPIEKLATPAPVLRASQQSNPVLHASPSSTSHNASAASVSTKTPASSSALPSNLSIAEQIQALKAQKQNAPAAPAFSSRPSIESELGDEDEYNESFVAEYQNQEFHRQMMREQLLCSTSDVGAVDKADDLYVNFPAMQEYIRWRASQAPQDAESAYADLSKRLELVQGWKRDLHSFVGAK